MQIITLKTEDGVLNAYVNSFSVSRCGIEFPLSVDMTIINTDRPGVHI